MAISKIKGGAINDDAISTAKIVDDAVTDAKIVDSYTTSVKTNPEFQGTEAARMPVGTTAERANAQSGDIRFNSTISLMEYYDGVQWKAIDAPPTVTSISPSNIADSDSSVDIVITGSNFSSGSIVKAIGQDASEITAGTVVVDSSTQITATFDGTSFSDAQEDYDIKVTASSGLSATLDDSLSVNASPAWTVSAGSLGTIYDSGRTSVSITTGATDDEGATLTYALVSGSLPSGLSLSTSTGTISGTAAAVGSDTTSSFTLSVTDGTNTVTRAYSIIVKSPVITSYTSTGGFTTTVPTGVQAMDVLVVAGGGGSPSGSPNFHGGGGAGGLIYRPAFPVTPGGSISGTVGGGGPGYNNGQNSTFGTLTALGGGCGGRFQGTQGAASGGSGGGVGRDHPTPTGGTGQQPSQPGDSGTYGFGNPGGGSAAASWSGAGGGGGAGAAGQNGTGGAPNTEVAGNGGIGKQYDISGSQVYYAGGGGGSQNSSGNPSTNPGVSGQGGQGGGGQAYHAGVPRVGQNGQANRGGGAGGYGNGAKTDGGSGIVIIKY